MGDKIPSYSDLGSSARNVFSTGFAYDLFKAKKTKSFPDSNLGLEAAGHVNLKTTEPAGSLKAEYKNENYGKLSVKVSSTGPIVGEYSTNGIIGERVDLDAGYSYNFNDAFQSASFKAKYHNSHLYASGALTKDFDRSADLVGSAVVKLQNILVGYKIGYDTNTSSITKNDVAVAMDQGGTGFHFRCVQIPREFGLSIFHKVNDNLDVAMDAKIASNDADKLWFFGAGMAYKVDEQCKLRVKFDKNLQLGTSLQFNAVESVQLTLAFNLDMSNPTAGQHKVGLGLDFKG